MNVVTTDSSGGNDPLLAAGIEELQRARELAEELHAGCCEPLRSPRMKALAATLEAAHTAVSGLDQNPATAEHVVTLFEDAGAQLGYLQVACCTPARTKLYSESLRCLGRTQRLIKRSLDLGH